MESAGGGQPPGLSDADNARICAAGGYDGGLPRLRAAMCIAVLLALGTAPARAQERDDWLGTDKLLHFSVSTGLAAGGYGAGLALFDCELERALLGGSLALGVGTAKELVDLAGAGDASFRDFTWDVIGAATGVLIMWAVDLLFLPRRCACAR